MGMDAKEVTRERGSSYWMGSFGKEKLGTFSFFQENLSSSGHAFPYVVIVVTLTLKTFNNAIY